MLSGNLRPRTGPKLTRDEELGKRDDDFRPRAKSSSFASSICSPSKWRKKRFLLTLLLILGLIYAISQNIPTQLSTFDEGLKWLEKAPAIVPGPPGQRAANEPSGAPSRTSDDEEKEAQYYYNGPIKFYRLASSLHDTARTMGHRPMNKNVLFAASSLKSAANLIPMACEMSKYDRNHVHLAIMGRDVLPMETILEINAVNTDNCTVFFHDARGDYAEFSSEFRAEIAVSGAMKHINDFIHPQAIITDDSALEDKFFTRAVRYRAKEYDRPLIEIPAGRYGDFLWVTRLDSGSLSNWFKPTIDILIHAPTGSSGGIINLVKTLLRADYSGLPIPKITVELPPFVDNFVLRYLEDVVWPPTMPDSRPQTRTLTMRHRIPGARLGTEEASVRFVESFYPSNPTDNHVLVLSPRTEVSPLYLQYLYYTLLEYKYSSYEYPEVEDLLGLSLSVPNVYLNGSTDFVRPTMADMNSLRYKDDDKLDKTANSFFTYQAPSASASLIFGEHWVTFHDYLSNRIDATHAGKSQKQERLVTELEPSWLEYLLELMRARGWVTLFPPTSYATVHNEFAKLPEEYVRPSKNREGVDEAEYDRLKQEPFLASPDAASFKIVKEDEVARRAALHHTLPLDGDLPELPHLPFLTHTGEMSPQSRLDELTSEYLPHFRREIGGCDAATAKKDRVIRTYLTDDLFCLSSQDLEFDTESRSSDNSRNDNNNNNNNNDNNNNNNNNDNNNSNNNNNNDNNRNDNSNSRGTEDHSSSNNNNDNNQPTTNENSNPSNDQQNSNRESSADNSNQENRESTGSGNDQNNNNNNEGN